MKGFIIYPTYKVINNKAYVLLYGRLENNKTFLTVNEFKPYFYIKTKDLEKSKKLLKIAEFEETSLTNFKKEKVSKVVLNMPKEVPHSRDKLEDNKIITYEADVRFEYRFLIDNNLKGSIEIDGDYELDNDQVDIFFKNPELKPSNYIPKNLKVLSLDIETSFDSKKLFCLSFYSKDYEKSFIISKNKYKNTISCDNEKDLLEMFQEELLKFDPDIVTGWNLINFDLDYLKKKFNKYRIPFVLGRDNSLSTIRIEKDFFRTSKAKFQGRLVLDSLDLVKGSFIKLPDYKLNTAAKQLLGKSKLIESLGKEKYEEIDSLYIKNKKKLLDYNLQDSKLVYEILFKSTVFDLTIQRSLLTGMPMDRVNASIASLDSLYLQKAKEHKLVSPTGDFKEKPKPITGGFVMESTPGIYDNLIVLDFKSLYPSLIQTFNIDPASYLEKKEINSIKSPNGAYFINQEGILPEIISELWEARDKVRKEKNELARFAIKIHLNSMFGVLANPACRFFNTKIANAITTFGHFILKNTRSYIEKKGFEVIYGDTDGLFINTKTNSKNKASEIGRSLEKEINEYYKNFIKKEYKRDSQLELEFEKCYIRFLMPKIRSGESGAKKRYAGLLIKDDKEKLEIVGLEFQRSDWTEASKIFQKELLKRIFEKKEVTNFIKKFVNDVLSGKYDKELVYRKQLRKDLESYTKTTPPHVKAARKLKKIKSNMIEYYITKKGPEPLENLTHEIDYEHYIEKQIKPIADSVLDFFNVKFEDILEGSKQTNLFNY